MRISNTMPNLITMPAVSITMAAGQKLKDLIAVTPVVSIEIYFAVNKTARPQIRLLMYQGISQGLFRCLHLQVCRLAKHCIFWNNEG